jgi:hypothetical protein
MLPAIIVHDVSHARAARLPALLLHGEQQSDSACT